MTVGEIKNILDQYPDTMEVYMAEVDTGFQYTPVEKVDVRTINFKEDPGGRTLASHQAVVIDSF